MSKRLASSHVPSFAYENGPHSRGSGVCGPEIPRLSPEATRALIDALRAEEPAKREAHLAAQRARGL